MLQGWNVAVGDPSDGATPPTGYAMGQAPRVPPAWVWFAVMIYLRRRMCSTFFQELNFRVYARV